MILDISVAPMRARTDEEIYVKTNRDIKSRRFRRLKAVINGTPMASQQWQDYSAVNGEHCDDFSIVGEISMLEHVREHFKERQEQDISSSDKCQLTILDGILSFDERYGRSELDKCGMGQEKSAVTPGSKEAMSTAENAEKKVVGHGYSHRDYRSLAAVCQYMSEMMHDKTFTTKEVMREASNPTMGSLQTDKRIARYLRGRPRCLLSFRWAAEKSNTLTVIVDSGWARSFGTRCSTSGRGTEDWMMNS